MEKLVASRQRPSRRRLLRTPPKRAASRQLAAPQPPFHLLLARWPGVLFRQRADFTFDYLSPSIEAFTGLTPAEWLADGKNFWEIIHEADAEELRRRIECCRHSPEGTETSFRVRHGRTGRVAYVTEFRRATRAAGGQVNGYEGFWQDVSRQTISERRLASAAWKETLAVLTMGLAHDFSNLLAGVLALSESFLQQLEAEHPFREGLNLIHQNARQASQLVYRIVNLHHGQIGERTYHNLNEIVADTVELLRKVIPRRITIQARIAEQPLPVCLDAVELRQLVINLALNAADAMPESGQLSFETSRHETLPVLTHMQGAWPRLPAVCFSVADTGCGIAPQHLTGIFEPFFTTKARNKGSGLGLYNARVFVEKHGGAISVESAPGAGARFQVWLPQSDLTEADPARQAGRRRCLLLVGQSTPARTAMAEFLRQHNYHVVTADAAAVEEMLAGDYRFDGLLLLAEGHAPAPFSVIEQVQREQPSCKIILQIIGRNQDDLETTHLQRSDLVISEDMAEEVIVRKLSGLFETSAAGLS